MEIQGLRTAKRLVRKQVAVVKGERGEYARGYRRAIADLMAAISAEMIDAEIDRHTAKETKGTTRKSLLSLKPKQTIREFLAEMAKSGRQMSGADFIELLELDQKNIDEVARAKLKTRTQVMEETGRWGPHGPNYVEFDETLEQWVKMEDLAEQARRISDAEDEILSDPAGRSIAEIEAALEKMDAPAKYVLQKLRELNEQKMAAELHRKRL